MYCHSYDGKDFMLCDFNRLVQIERSRNDVFDTCIYMIFL